MFIAQHDNWHNKRPRILEKAREMAELMRACHGSLDRADQAGVLKLARALRIVLDNSDISLNEIGITAAEINGMIVEVPDRNDSVSSFGFLEEQMDEELAPLAEELRTAPRRFSEIPGDEISGIRTKNGARPQPVLRHRSRTRRKA